jgi:muramoyltetrapeptide carboxypeptidase
MVGAMGRLAALGFRIVPDRSIEARLGFLAGTDEVRAQGLGAMLGDPTVQLLLAVRGGYGMIRLLPRLNFADLAANPKAVMGFSDITVLHCMVQSAIGLVTFHGPNLLSLFDDESGYSYDIFRRVTGGEGVPEGIVAACPGWSGVQILVPGRAEGILVGGNLMTLASLVGTGYLPSFAGKVVFLEEVGEAPYRIDRSLTQLLLATDLAGAAGFAIGVCNRCEDPLATDGGEYRQRYLDVVYERLGAIGVPVVAELPFGHIPQNATLPVSGWGVLDGARGDLLIPPLPHDP